MLNQDHALSARLNRDFGRPTNREHRPIIFDTDGTRREVTGAGFIQEISRIIDFTPHIVQESRHDPLGIDFLPTTGKHPPSGSAYSEVWIRRFCLFAFGKWVTDVSIPMNATQTYPGEGPRPLVSSTVR